MAAPSKVRTRHQTECKLTEYLSKSGESTPKELLSTEGRVVARPSLGGVKDHSR